MKMSTARDVRDVYMDILSGITPDYCGDITQTTIRIVRSRRIITDPDRTHIITALAMTQRNVFYHFATNRRPRDAKDADPSDPQRDPREDAGRVPGPEAGQG